MKALLVCVLCLTGCATQVPKPVDDGVQSTISFGGMFWQMMSMAGKW